MERMTGRNQYGAYVELNKYSDLLAMVGTERQDAIKTVNITNIAMHI